MKIFRGAPVSELEAFVKQELRIDAVAKLRFTDEEGDPTMLSSHCPSGTVLHVAEEMPIEQPIISYPRFAAVVEVKEEPSEEAQWRRWFKYTNPRTGRAGTISNGSQVWAACDDDYGATAFSGSLPATGQHYIVAEVSHTPCCNFLGLVPSSTDAFPANLTKEQFPHMLAIMAFRRGNGPYESSTEGCGPPYNESFSVGILVDMDAKVVHFFPHEFNSTKVIRMDALPQRVKLGVFHRKHGLRVHLLRDAELPRGAKVLLPKKRVKREM